MSAFQSVADSDSHSTLLRALEWMRTGISEFIVAYPRLAIAIIVVAFFALTCGPLLLTAWAKFTQGFRP